MKPSSRSLPASVIAALLATPVLGAPPPIRSHQLKNGLEVLVVESHALPLVTIEFAAKNGSMTESPEYNGLSHLYEHMFFKANSVIPDQEAYLARMRELGMQFNGSTDTERVNYFFTTTSDHLRDSMAFMRDAIVSPLFDEKELERERVVVTGEIDRNESSPFYHFFHEVSKHLWWKYPSRKDPLGNRQTVLSATREKMKIIQRRYYVPNNSVLVVTGDVNAGDIFAQADSLFENWKRSEDPFKKYPLVKHPPLPRTEVVVVEQPVETVSIQVGWHGPSTVGKSVKYTYAADLLSFALQDPVSLFQKRLVDSGACVRAGLSWYTQQNTGPITLSLEAIPEKADECARAAIAELPKMKMADYFSDEELKNAAHRLEVAQAQERETPSQLAHVLSFWWASAGLPYYLGYSDNVTRVTRQDMAAYLDEYLLDKHFVFGVMVSPEMARDQHLDREHFEKLIGRSAPTARSAPSGQKALP